MSPFMNSCQRVVIAEVSGLVEEGGPPWTSAFSLCTPKPTASAPPGGLFTEKPRHS